MADVIFEDEVVRFNGIGKFQIAHCVFMCTANTRCAGQRGQLVHRLQHLFGSALEQTATTTRKKGVATKKQGSLISRLCIISNVSSRVTWNIDGAKVQALPAQFAALCHGLIFKPQFFVRGAIDLGAPFALKGAYAARVIAMVMRD